MHARSLGLLVALGSLVGGVTSCDDGATGVEFETALLSVAPAGGAAGVAVDEEVVVTFNHAMHDHAVDFAAVHEGDVAGPAVAGTWVLEESRKVMRFTPDQPWKRGTVYTIHLGGGMQDAQGHMVEFASHGMSMGGMWANGGMMGGGMMGDAGHPHMGAGWKHPANGSYGMVFTFTTAE